LYVGITRAKMKLFLFYTGVKSSFLKDEINLYTTSINNIYNSNSLNVFKNNSLQKLQIKELRAKIANILGMRTDEVIDNNTINKLVEIQPKSKEELKNFKINGFFLNKFGDEIINIFK